MFLCLESSLSSAISRTASLLKPSPSRDDFGFLIARYVIFCNSFWLPRWLFCSVGRFFSQLRDHATHTLQSFLTMRAVHAPFVAQCSAAQQAYLALSFG